MIGSFFSKNIGDEMISLYSDIITDYDNKKKVALKHIINSFYSIDKKKYNPNISNKNLYEHVLNEMNNNGKMRLIEITKRLEKYLNNIYLLDHNLKKECLNKIELVKKIMRFDEVSDIKLNSVKILLSSIIHSIMSYFIVETFKGEIYLHEKFSKYDKDDDSISKYIDLYYEIENMMINQILSKLLSLYFLSNSAHGGSKFIVDNNIVDNVREILESDEYIDNRNYYKKVFNYLNNNIIEEIKGGVKLETVLKSLEKKNINVSELLENPEFLISLNMALGEIEMPKLQVNRSIETMEMNDGYDILNVIFGSKASGKLMDIFNNVNPNSLVKNLSDYKENINNDKELPKKVNKIPNLKNSFNFTDQDIEIIYTLNIIDALKSLGSTPLHEMYEMNKNPIDKNITVNFNCPVTEAKVDGIEIKNKK